MSELVKPADEATQGEKRVGPVSRRSFLKGSGAALATASIASLGAAAVVKDAPAVAQDATPAATATPAAGTAMGGPDYAVAFFSMAEARTVEALTARILPGTPQDPGAREAGVVFYIDRQLGGANLGYTLKTYTQGPFLVPAGSEAPNTVEASSQPNIYQTVLVAQQDVARYGFQSVMTPQETYRRGLAAVDAYAQSRFQKAFVDLTEEQQDSILTDMEAGKTPGFDGPSDKAFFTQLRNDTIEGMFSDPMYGGNRDLVGWKLIGYPGAQRFYTPADLKKPGTDRQPQSLAQMMAKEGQ